ncbi:MAG: hypothetical protein M1813_000486 [Trichoglossum hirsutum]|nr:MAG: hypothetical protein M1813_000486 [Trichoglossum hirsutum]
MKRYKARKRLTEMLGVVMDFYHHLIPKAKDLRDRPKEQDQMRGNQVEGLQRPDPSAKQLTRKPLTLNLDGEKTKPGSWLQDDVANNSLVGNDQFGLGPSSSRVVDVGEISGPWQRTEPQTTEVRGPGEGDSDSSVVMGRMYYHLRRVKSAYPSAHFEKDITHPCSPKDIEGALLDLIRAYGSVHQGVRDIEEALKTKEAEYESLQMKFTDDLDQRSKELEDRISKMERENEREKDRLSTTISVLRDEHNTREQKYDDKLKGIQQEHDDKLKKIQQEHQSETNAMVDGYGLQIQRLESDMEVLMSKQAGEVSKLERQHREQVAILNSAAREEMTRMESDFKMKIFQSQEALRSTREQYKVSREEIIDRHKEDMQEMANRFNAEKDQMKHDFRNEEARLSSAIRSQGEAYEIQLSSLKKQSREDKQRTVAEHRNEKAAVEKMLDEEKAVSAKNMQAAKASFQMQLRGLRDNHAQEMGNMAKRIEKIKGEHEAERKEIKDRHDAEKVQLKIKQEDENKDLKESVEKLKGALVKRDHFKAMSDHELAHRFQDLASEVDDFARVPWDNRLEFSWPFSDKSFRNSENERRTKQHIVQNNIWVILYEKIFCTPFRVLGNEGKLLEREWSEKYGQDRKSSGALAPCPKPSKESEKWRYEALKKHSGAVTQTLMAWEPNYNVKLSYEKSVKEAMEDISRWLERMASVSNDDKQRVTDLVRKAANLWLEVGQQRCRIFLLMSPPRSGQASLARDGTEELVAPSAALSTQTFELYENPSSMAFKIRNIFRRRKSQVTQQEQPGVPPGDLPKFLEPGRKITPEEIRDLGNLLRKRYELDVEIWGLRHVRPRDRPIVEEKMRKSDAILQKIRRTIDSWDRPDIFQSWGDWAKLQEIKRRIEEDGKRHWASNPPWHDKDLGEINQ